MAVATPTRRRQMATDADATANDDLNTRIEWRVPGSKPVATTTSSEDVQGQAFDSSALKLFFFGFVKVNF